MRNGTRKPGKSLTRAATLALAAGILALLSSVGTASAHQLFQYEFEKSFNGADSTAGAFTTGVKGIALNQSGHRVYVLDQHPVVPCCGPEGDWISQFNLSGEAIPFSGLAGVSSFEGGVNSGIDMVFDNTGHGGGLYAVLGPQGITNWNPDGTVKEEIPFFGGLYGLGIQPDGTLLTPNTNGVGRWDPVTNTQIPTASGDGSFLFEQGIQHIEVDTNGYVYGSKDFGEGDRKGLFKYFKGDENLGVCCKDGFIDESSLRFSYLPTSYMSLDRSDNDLFAVEGTEAFGHGAQVTEYSDDGQPITTFGLAEGPFAGLKDAKAVAVDSETHKVYVTSANGSGQIDIFKRKAPVTVPDVSTSTAVHPSKASGVLKGAVNPDSVKTTGCKFEWGTTTKYTEAPVTCEPGTEFEGTADNPVQASISSLTPGTIYHYRLVAKNGDEQWSYSADRTFEASLPPTVTPVIVDQVNTDGARFGSTIDPEGGTTTYHFELGEEDCSSSPCTQLPASPLEAADTADPRRSLPDNDGPPSQHPLLRAGGRGKRSRAGQLPPAVADLSGPAGKRPLRECPRPPADQRLAAARLSRL